MLCKQKDHFKKNAMQAKKNTAHTAYVRTQQLSENCVFAKVTSPLLLKF